MSADLAAGIQRVKGARQLGHRSGNWLSLEQSSQLVNCAYGDGLRERRDCAMVAILVGCGLRRAELANLPVEKIQIRQGHWLNVDLVGKGGHVRTIPIPQWAKEKLDRWTSAARISSGRVFRAIRKNGTVWGDRINVNVVWHVVNRYCRSIGLKHVAPHDCDGPAPSCATRAAANWNKFKSCSAMSLSRPRSGIWAASKI